MPNQEGETGSNQALMTRVIDSALQANALDAQTQRMVVAMFRLLARGEPVSPAGFAGAIRIPLEVIEQVVRSVPPGALDRDDEGNVVAFSGMSLKPTDHRMQLAGRTLYGWCAFDTLFLSALLGESTRIVSRDPVTGEAIRFELGSDGYQGSPELVMSFLDVSPEEMRSNVRAAFCHDVHFFQDRESGARYAADRAGLITIPIGDAIALARRWNESLYGDALAAPAGLART